MRKLDFPVNSSKETFLKCLEGISDKDLKERLMGCVESIEDYSSAYAKKAEEAELYQLPPLPSGAKKDVLVVDNVTKGELMDLYSTYVVNRSRGRQIYDEILVVANDRCPFCGEIGESSTLDHYLPKSRYPQFSVLPANLLPSCKDCNTGKGSAIAESKGQQVIHPYFDHDKFFKQKWVSARLVSTEPLAVEFYVDPPVDWNFTDRERVKTHFNDFKLSRRYSIQASSELAILVHQRKSLYLNYSKEDFGNHLRTAIGDTMFVNHWRTVLYQALSENDEFCSLEFG